MIEPLVFGTLGAAKITPRALIYPLVDEPRARCAAIAARDKARAVAFAEFAHIPNVLDDYQAVLDHKEINAVYIPLVISLHKEWTLKALAAGKHVLCEKSLAMNSAEAAEMAAAAAKRGLVLMEAYHYRYHPVFIGAKNIIQSGRIGTIQHIDAAFHIAVTDPEDIRMQYRLGGGVTMDIGCYPISWIRHLTDEQPEVVAATAEEGPDHIDLFLEATHEFPSGITATTSGDMRKGTRFRAEFAVTGSEGMLKVRNPLVPQTGHRLELSSLDGGEQETLVLDRRATYGYQLDAFIDAVSGGKPFPTDGEDATQQMHVIDACYEAAGLPVRGVTR